ncbi:MAG TPA: phosphate ABC transporter permease subunit PstC [Planctomycetaceae bacterium]|jgi:phosphate transport system permease protein|nr:phosphate ABC transporter permease subunit PstC [Planctomycetaceae bacterium]
MFKTPLPNTNVEPNRLTRRFSFAQAREQVIWFCLLCCALASVLTTLGIIYVLVTETLIAVPPHRAFFQEVSPVEFFTGTRWTPQFEEKHFGILPLVAGTFLVAGIAASIGLPIGLAGAIYLSEYASPRKRNVVKPILEILAGIPTVVYGYCALVFVTPYVLRPIFHGLFGFDVKVFNAASAGIVVAIMIIPIVTSLSEDALRSVPQALREAAYALGSTKYHVSSKVVVPAALSGVLASFLLAISRAVGETMAVAIAAGQTPALTLNPFRSVETMTAFIVNVSFGDKPQGSLDFKALFAVAMTLFVITLVMNILSELVMRRFREVYQ